ncbi:YqeG family HAD IIIA-type phosphatase [Laceyella putida]|uniref:YqeG family HAD IIIA-type phosphatase n=1 Tax=Laceyella putida TaxID=110101 RepID=A0ABW2RI98_9BACL
MVPDLFAQSIYAIDYLKLKQRGVKGIIVDLDNTLVESTRPDATPRLVEWLDELRNMGFHVMIVSNNNQTRVSHFAKPLGLPFIHTARKPLLPAFKKALKQMGTKPEETVVIGDQLLTDVFGGNRMGLYTILVAPVSHIDGFFTRINRRVERLVFFWMERKGYVRWDRSNKSEST